MPSHGHENIDDTKDSLAELDESIDETTWGNK